MRTNSQIAPTQDEEARVALAAEQSGGFLAGAREPVCTENLIRIDCATESPKRQRR
jgi:hypothetical protein